jgi:predicted nucleotidyltransferase
MHLTEAQLAIIKAWADQTPELYEVRLFGSYAKGCAHAGSDIDIAIAASDGNWTALASKWEQHLSEVLGGLTVNLRTLKNPTVRGYCDDCSVPLSCQAADQGNWPTKRLP